MPISRVKEHMKLRQYIVNMTLRSDPESPIPPERELAKMFAVARGTVRRTLDKMVADHYLIKVPRRGYFTNASANYKFSREKKLLGLLLYRGAMSFYEAESIKVIRAFFTKAERLKFNVQIVYISDLSNISEEVAQYRFDGLFWWGPSDEQVIEFEKMHNSDLPVVALCQGIRQPSCGNYIWLDHALEIYTAFDYLLSCGAKCIALFTNIDKERFVDSCESIFKKYNLPFQSEFIFDNSEFNEKIPAIIDSIDGIICQCDQSGVIRDMANERSIKIPEDLQIVSNYINTDSSPTSTCKPHFKIISEAIDKLVELMDKQNGESLQKTDYDWGIIEGETTKRLGFPLEYVDNKS